MRLLVQKFGGSSVADAEKLLHVANIIRKEWEKGSSIIAVVSAQGDTTDRLIEKAREMVDNIPERELDSLLSTGEQASASLLSITLESIGVPSVSLGAWQLPIRTDGPHGDAGITAIGHSRVLRELGSRRVAVCAGFQGVDKNGDMATLGRGGSDYTAVALAAEFKAERCLIYTDVDGVYTADPRLCPTARRLKRVSYEDMYALARSGARVLHDKCVSLARERGVEPEVLSCRGDGETTRIAETGEGGDVTGVTMKTSEDSEYAAVTLVGAALPSLALEKRALLALDAAGIKACGIDAGERTLTLYVERSQSREALCGLHDELLN